MATRTGEDAMGMAPDHGAGALDQEEEVVPRTHGHGSHVAHRYLGARSYTATTAGAVPR